MFKFFIIFYLIVNGILFLKFDKFSYVEKIEDVKMLEKLPENIHNNNFVKNFKLIKIQMPKEKSWTENLITDLGQTRYLNYGTNLEYDLIGSNIYCIKTPKVIKIYNKNKQYFQLSSSYKNLYASNRGLPKDNCFDLKEKSKLVINFDVFSNKNYLIINDKKIKLIFDDTFNVNPLLLLVLFLLIIFVVNFYFLLSRKNNDMYIL